MVWRLSVLEHVHHNQATLPKFRDCSDYHCRTGCTFSIPCPPLRSGGWVAAQMQAWSTRSCSCGYSWIIHVLIHQTTTMLLIPYSSILTELWHPFPKFSKRYNGNCIISHVAHLYHVANSHFQYTLFLDAEILVATANKQGWTVLVPKPEQLW